MQFLRNQLPDFKKTTFQPKPNTIDELKKVLQST